MYPYENQLYNTGYVEKSSIELNKNLVYQRDCALMIDEEKIKCNIQGIRKLTEKQIIAVIKENGYGIGLWNEYIIMKRQGISFFAVSHYEEAKRLRNFGFMGNLLLLSPELSGTNCISLLKDNVIFMLGSKEQADILKEAASVCHIIPRVHLKIDTGLGRYGFLYKRLDEVKESTEGFYVEGCYTHFTAEGRFFEHNVMKQVRRFHKALKELEKQEISYGMTHASSSRVLSYIGDLGFDAVRIGSLFLGRGAGNHKDVFRDAVCLQSKIYMCSIKRKGETLGYGNGIKLKKDSRVGLVRVGHADGVLIGDQDDNDSIKKAIKLLLACLKKQKYYVSYGKRRAAILGKIGISHLLIDLPESDECNSSEIFISVNPLLVNPLIKRIIIRKHHPPHIFRIEYSSKTKKRSNNRKLLTKKI